MMMMWKNASLSDDAMSDFSAEDIFSMSDMGNMELGPDLEKIWSGKPVYTYSTKKHNNPSSRT